MNSSSPERVMLTETGCLVSLTGSLVRSFPRLPLLAFLRIPSHFDNYVISRGGTLSIDSLNTPGFITWRRPQC